MLKQKIDKFRTAMHDIRRLIGPDRGHETAVLLFWMTLVALLDVVGVGALVQVAALLTDTSQVAESTWIGQFQAALQIESLDGTIFALMVVLLLASALRTFLLGYVTVRQHTYTLNTLVLLNRRVMGGYLRQPYPYFMTRNSAVMLRNLTNETNRFSTGVILNALTFIANSFVVGFLTIFLVIIDPLVNGVIILVASLAFALLYAVTRHPIRRWGRAREARFAEANRVAHQALFGIKEVKALGVEQLYMNQYMHQLSLYGHSQTHYMIVTSMLTRSTHAIITIGLAVGVIYALINGLQMSTLFESLAPYIVTAYAGMYRIYPALMTSLNSLLSTFYYWYTREPLLDALPEDADIAIPDDAGLQQLPFTDRIEFDSVTFTYPESRHPSVEQASFDVSAGEHVALVGASGAGKSTAVDLLLGLLEPDSGEIRVDGQALTEPRRWRLGVGYVPQQIFLADDTLRYNIAMSSDVVDDERVLAALHVAGLKSVLADLPDGLDTQLGESGARLSGGERQRVGIARALYRRPHLLVLDEPTSALDASIEGEILRDVFALGRDLTIVIISHRLSAVENCDRLHYLEHGHVVASGSYNELLAQVPAFARLAAQQNQPIDSAI